MFNEKAQAGLLFLDDLIALHSVDMFSEYTLLLPFQSKNPKEVRDVICGGWLGALGPPKCHLMDEGNEWEN